MALDIQYKSKVYLVPLEQTGDSSGRSFPFSSRKAARRFIDWTKRVDATLCGDIDMDAHWCFCLLEPGPGTRTKAREGGESGDKRLTFPTRRVSYLLINRQLYACAFMRIETRRGLRNDNFYRILRMDVGLK
jgi:hypothetical protein